MKQINMDEVVIHPKYGPIEILENLGIAENGRRYVKVCFKNTGYITTARYDIFKAGRIQDEYYGIDFNKIYNTNTYGPVQILEYLGRGKDHRVYVRIRFLNSGALADVELRQVLKGSVGDPQFGVNFDKIYPSNQSGPFRFLEICPSDGTGHTKARIQFLLTGYEKIVQIQNAFGGEVKDDTQSNIIPIDRSLVDNWDNYVLDRLRTIWKNMYERCIITTSRSYQGYGAKGVTLHQDWMDINTFINDAKYLPQYEKFYNQPNIYQLDKDYLQANLPRDKRVYSKETCMFLHYLDNSNMRAIDYRNNNINTISSKYFGVIYDKDRGYYISQLMINGKSILIGRFTNEIMAAAAFNFFERKYHPYELIPLFNDVPDIPPTEFIKYNISAKQLYHLIHK